jgi:hypothetical protein
MTSRVWETRLADGLGLAVNKWAVWLAAAVFGGLCSALAYAAFKSVPESYPDFIAGAMTTTGNSKVRDYAMLVAFMAGGAAFFAAIGLLMQRLRRAGGVADVFYDRLIIAVIPTMTWCATFLLPRAENIGLYWLSAFLVTATVTATALAAARAPAWAAGRPAAYVGNAVDGFLLLPIAAVLAVLAVAMAGNRVAILFGPAWVKIPNALYWAAAVAGVSALAVGVLALTRSASPERANTLMRRVLIVVQVLLPGLFLAALPSPIGPVDRRYFYLEAIPASAWAVFAVLAVALWADLARLWRAGERSDGAAAQAVSILSLIAVIIYCRMPPIPLVGSPFDDYHFGEDLIPWWSWMKHGLVPLWDFTPPRGLINYKMGAFAAVFTDQTAAGLLATVPYIFGGVVLVVFAGIALFIGRWRALLLVSFAAMEERLGDIDALMTAALCILGYAWIRLSHVKWLVTWLAVGTAAVLLAPGQGGLLVMATMPGGAWRLYQALREERPALLKTAAGVVVVLAVLGLATPMGLMVAGAIRYGAGQSAVNGIANGLPWFSSFGSMAHVHPWLFEILRFSWIGVGAVAIVLTVWAWASARREHRGLVLFIGATVTLLCFLYVIRSAVRVDAGFVGRPGWTSIWALAFLLPILVSVLLHGTRQLTALAVVMTAAAALTGQFGIVGLDRVFARPFQSVATVAAAEAGTVDGAALGMPNLGRVRLEDSHVKRLVGVKTELDKLLDPQETFMDMTNRGAQYFYFDRVPPSDLSAFYNMITIGQQQRAIAGLQKHNVQVALIGADNTLLDGLPASLRAPLVYRHLLLNYVPVTLGGYDFMVRPERLARVGLTGVAGQPDEEAFKILDRDFLLPNLEGLPLTWGKSEGSLADRMREILKLDSTRLGELADAARADEGVYRATGPAPKITFDLASSNLRGRDAGLLRFSYACLGKRAKPTFFVRWTDEDGAHGRLRFPGRKGDMIVPLDAAPRWLLSGRLQTLTIEMTHAAGCETFALRDVALAQRKDVDEVAEKLQLGAHP